MHEGNTLLFYKEDLRKYNLIDVLHIQNTGTSLFIFISFFRAWIINLLYIPIEFVHGEDPRSLLLGVYEPFEVSSFLFYDSRSKREFLFRIQVQYFTTKSICGVL